MAFIPNLLKRRWKCIILIVTLSIFHNEFFVFWQDSLSWPRLECGSNKNAMCQSLLVVSDPQILGYSSEPSLRFLSYVDSDLYLKRAFCHALNHVKPDVILFLGDLMDEGSSASDEEYLFYKKRFDWIFNTSDIKPLIIYIPGDNDIGGEGNDRVTHAKMERFYHNFGSTTELTSNNIHYLIVNRMSSDHNFPEVAFDDNKFRVVLSHIPLTFIDGIFSRAVMEKLKPHIIFSAHDHRIAMATTRLERNNSYFERADIKSIEYSAKIEKTMNNYECVEIMWPTCSYRMGVAKAGYGAATISSDGKVEIGVLWVHSRFRVLILYLFMVVLCLGIYLFPRV